MPGHHDPFKTSITRVRQARPNTPSGFIEPKSTDIFLALLNVLATRVGSRLLPSVGSWSKMWGNFDGSPQKTCLPD